MTTRVLQDRQAASDARLGLGVALASATAFALFVVLPFYAPSVWGVPGIEPLAGLGALTAVLLGPVAAGLSGWVSLVALWSRGDSLTTSARHDHLLTMVVAAALLGALLSPWGVELTAWLRD